MEYFIGSTVTIILLIGLLFFVRRVPQENVHILKTSQSRVFELVGRHLLGDFIKPRMSQTIKHEQSMMLKVFIIRDEAYWIKDNKVFTATIIDNEINSDDGIEVDIMSMDEVKLKEMLFIIDQLKEGSNDNRDSGK